MFWKNAKTLKYEYIQRERDAVSVPMRCLFGKSALACFSVCTYVYLLVALIEALGVAAHFSALFPFVSTVVPDAKWNAKRII